MARSDRKHRPPGAPAAPASFAEAAAAEGVAPLPRAGGRVRPPVSPPRAVRPPPPPFTVADEAGWLEGAREGLARHHLRALGAVPAAILDLHGHDELAARRAVQGFVRAHRKRGDRLVMVVVGRGRHSPGGVGVLRQSIAGWLVELGEHVLAFRTASPDLGGDGAVVILLAPP